MAGNEREPTGREPTGPEPVERVPMEREPVERVEAGEPAVRWFDPVPVAPTARSFRMTALRTAVVYAVFAAVWIAVSDQLLEAVVRDPTLVQGLGTAKGLLFVGVTAAVLYLLVRSDLAGLQRSEEANRESERRHLSLLEGFGLLVLVVDRTGRIVYCNRHFLRVTGWTAAEVVGRDWFDTFVPAAERDVRRARLAGIDTLARQQDVTILTRAGEERLIAAALDVVLAADGSLLGYTSVGEDVTDHRALEAERRQSQKMEAVGRLAGGVAHDFNNLLTAITGYTQLVLAELPEDSAVRGDVVEIGRAAERAASLTRQLLSFSRQQVVQPEVVSLATVVHDVEPMLRRLIGESIDLRVVASTGAPYVRADRGEIEQVILNLALNARDAMPDGGTLTIETSAAPANAAGSNSAPVARLVVRDTGLGMDSATLTRAFEPFFSTKRAGQGTGLGLATVYAIVTQADGQIDAVSNPGSGATFTVTFPRSAEAPATKIAPTAYRASDGAGRTLLVAEDEAAVRTLVRHVLERHGYAVLEASNGSAALELLRAHDGVIDLLVTDLVMPGIGGRDLARRAAGIRPAMQVLYMSGYSDEAARPEQAALLGRHFLRKPFDPADLVRRVEELLAGERGPEATSGGGTTQPAGVEPGPATTE